MKLMGRPWFHPEVLFAMLIFKMIRDGKLPPGIITLKFKLNGSASIDIPSIVCWVLYVEHQ